MEYIYIGRIVNTHGIKGEVRIISDFKYKEKIFKKGKKIYIGNELYEEIINTYRHHKIFDMITMKNITNINDVLKYKGKNIYTTREELNLKDSEYLEEDLIGLDVIVNNKKIGIVKNYIKDKYQDKIIVNKNEKDYLVPFVYDIIEDINLKNHTITIKKLDGLLD